MPVSSSMIAMWLKTCLSEAGIDTGIFKVVLGRYTGILSSVRY